jgi:hypothetical protein
MLQLFWLSYPTFGRWLLQLCLVSAICLPDGRASWPDDSSSMPSHSTYLLSAAFSTGLMSATNLQVQSGREAARPASAICCSPLPWRLPRKRRRHGQPWRQRRHWLPCCHLCLRHTSWSSVTAAWQ